MKKRSLVFVALISILVLSSCSGLWFNPFSFKDSTYIKLDYDIAGVDQEVMIEDEDLVKEIIEIFNNTSYYENEVTVYDERIIKKGFDYYVSSDTNYFYFNSEGELYKFNKTVGKNIFIEKKHYYWKGSIDEEEDFDRLIEIFGITIE